MCRRHFSQQVPRWTCLDVPSHCDICELCAADPWLSLSSSMKLHTQLDQWVLGPAGALPDWVTRLTQACPFLFERRARQIAVMEKDLNEEFHNVVSGLCTRSALVG